MIKGLPLIMPVGAPPPFISQSIMVELVIPTSGEAESLVLFIPCASNELALTKFLFSTNEP